jgi:hypothetical protein
MNLREARQAIKAVMQAVEEPSRVPGATIKRIDFGPNGAVTRGEVVSVARRTWGGVPGWSWVVRERGQFGRRTHYTWWLEKAVMQPTEWEAGTLVAYTVTGNPDKDTFQELADTHEIKIEGLALS